MEIVRSERDLLQLVLRNLDAALIRSFIKPNFDREAGFRRRGRNQIHYGPVIRQRTPTPVHTDV